MEDDILYGFNPVLEALKAERQILHRIFLSAERPEASFLALRRLAREKGIPVKVLPKEALTKLAGTTRHQGVIGLLADTPYASFEDLKRFIRSDSNWMSLLILDGIEDPQNFGSLIRTAEAGGVKGIIIPKDRAVGITPAAFRASAGAAAHIPIIRVTNLAHTLEELKKEGFWIVGADARAEKNLYQMKFDMKVGLVIGSEGKGIRPLILKKCDFTVSIPMKGKISSLNAAIAGAIILFEILRQQISSKVS